MIRRFKPHMDILPEAQKRLWPQLHRAPELGFVLYGGKAIALRIGHRSSVDFVFFTNQQLDKTAMQNAFPFLKTKATVLQESIDTYTVLLSSDPTIETYVKLSFFGGIEFGRVSEPELTEDNVLQIASLDDLMATKLQVILQRVEAKDYIDIAAMLDAGVNLSKGLASARAMYGSAFQPSESLKVMVYFQGGDLHTLSPAIKRTLIEASRNVRALPPAGQLERRLALMEYKPI